MDHTLPHIQGFEQNRNSDLHPTLNGTIARADLLYPRDPLVDLVRHRVDPAKGTFDTEYRRDDSVAATSFATTITWTRFVEYRDVNQDQRFENGTDLVAHSWRMDQFRWVPRVNEWRGVFVGGQRALAVAYTGNTSNAPAMRLELAVVGLAVTDEGARARQQDQLMYLDMSDFPTRGGGNLYAIEGTARSPAAVTIDTTLVGDVNGTWPVAFLARNADDTRLSYFDWGAQATLDGNEQFVNATLGAPTKDGTYPFVWDFPLFDKTLHMVMVQGVEYVNPSARTPAWGAAFAVAVLVGAAIALRRER